MTKKQTRQRRNDGARTNIDVDGTGNLDQVRELLFGRNLRSLETRLDEVEKRLQREYAELTDASDARFESVEAHVSSEVAGVATRLESATKGQTDSLKSVERDLAAVSKKLEERLQRLQDQADAIMAALKQRTDDLDSRKADTVALARAFASMAEQLAQLADGEDA